MELDPMDRRAKTFWSLYVGAALIFALLGAICGQRQVVFNASASMPSGFYIRTDSAPSVGAIVDFPVPESMRGFIERRQGSYDRRYLLKTIAAAAGDRVNCSAGRIEINGEVIAEILKTDSAGSPIPTWAGDRLLGAGEIFVVSTRIARSFDSRVFGPIRTADITGVYRKLW